MRSWADPPRVNAFLQSETHGMPPISLVPKGRPAPSVPISRSAARITSPRVLPSISFHSDRRYKIAVLYSLNPLAIRLTKSCWNKRPAEDGSSNWDPEICFLDPGTLWHEEMAGVRWAIDWIASVPGRRGGFDDPGPPELSDCPYLSVDFPRVSNAQLFYKLETLHPVMDMR
jgi:hypothetical protein